MGASERVSVHFPEPVEAKQIRQSLACAEAGRLVNQLTRNTHHQDERVRGAPRPA
jgi:hypothetical protein